MPELNGYEAEIIHGLYRGNLYANETPTYHRRSPAPVQPA
jgi:hypothetical protein